MPDRGAPGETCRLDVWLWRARFFKSRADSGAFIQTGRIRLRRAGLESRPHKVGKVVRVGDELIFAIAGRLRAVRVEALGVRRGPPAEARTLWRPLDTLGADPRSLRGIPPRCAIDNAAGALTNTPAEPAGPPSSSSTVIR